MDYRAHLRRTARSGKMSKHHHELKVLQHFNPFEEFTTEEIDKYKAQFDKFDIDGNHVLDFMELKRMMEILGAPQTHVQLKDMIKEIDDDFDGSINFTEFLLIFKKARDGELSSSDGLLALARMTSIDVSQAGVSGAKNFFEAKAKVLTDSNLARRASNAGNGPPKSSGLPTGHKSPQNHNHSAKQQQHSNSNRGKESPAPAATPEPAPVAATPEPVTVASPEAEPEPSSADTTVPPVAQEEPAPAMEAAPMDEDAAALESEGAEESPVPAAEDQE